MFGILLLLLACAAADALFGAPGAGMDVSLAWVNFAIPAVTSIASALLSRRGGGGGGNAPGSAEMLSEERRSRTAGQSAEDDYLSYLGGFDAEESARRSAGAMSGDWMKTFGRQLEGLRGSQVSRGRLDTGYGMEDEDRYVTDFNQGVADKITGMSMDATRMNMGAAQARGELGERMTGRATDLAASRRDQYLTDRASKRAMYGGIGSSLLQAGGQVLGAYAGRPR